MKKEEKDNYTPTFRLCLWYNFDIMLDDINYKKNNKYNFNSS